MHVNPPHSVVTALAKDGKRRAAGRAGYAQRWTGKNHPAFLFVNPAR